MTFEEQISSVIENEYPKNDMLYLCDTPSILQEIGLENLPITMTQKHVKTIMNKEGKESANYHDLGNLLKMIPQALTNPIKVLNSNTRNDSIVVVTNLFDKENRPIIVSICFCGKALIDNQQLSSNVLTSAYGRSNYSSFVFKNKNNLLYDNKLGIIKRTDNGRIQFPTRVSSYDNNISHKDILVNNSNMQKNNKYSVKEEAILYGYYSIEILNYM